MTKQTISDRIREARTDAGMTQQQVADAIGIQVSTICRYEKGQTPGLERAAELAGVLGVRLMWIIDGTRIVTGR